MPVDRWDRTPESYHSDGDESIDSVEFARRQAIIISMGMGDDDFDYVVTARDRMTDRNRTLLDATDRNRTLLDATDLERTLMNMTNQERALINRQRTLINRTSPELRQSNRLKGDSSATQISINDECFNKTCPIKLKKIKDSYGIKLSDGQWYNADEISRWYTDHEYDAVQTTPFRVPYSDENITQINDYLRKRVGGGSRRKRIRRRNTKTTRKKRKTCKKRKPCKRQ